MSRNIVKIDTFPRDRISGLVHDARVFIDGDRAKFSRILANDFSGQESAEFYKGFVTANDYAAGIERAADPKETYAYMNLYVRSTLSAYLLHKITMGQRDEFKATLASSSLDKPLSDERIKRIVPKDCIYDYSLAFVGNQSDDFYRGLVKGFDGSTLAAQNLCRNTNTHVQLDLITMFVAYKILEKQGQKPPVEVLSPYRWRPVVVTDGVIGYEERPMLDDN